MKKNIFISLLVVAIVATIFSGCKLYYTQYVYKPNDELYEYCAFDSLSYWIYEDSATMEIDSVVTTNKIEKASSETKDNSTPIGIVHTYLQYYNIININNGYSRKVEMEPFVLYAQPRFSDTDLKPQELYVIASSYYFQEDYNIMELNWFYMNISNPSEIECYCIYPDRHSTYKLSNFYDSICINDCTYKNVKKIEITIYENDTIVCYWASKIGMVRWEYHSFDGTTSKIKNLIRYNVVNVQNQYK